MTTSMIAYGKGMGRALARIGGFRSPAMRSPNRCRSLRNSSLALRNSSLLVCDAFSSTMNWSCLRACSTRTSAKRLSWSALDDATVSWRVLTVSISCCMVMSPPSFPNGPCLVFLISPDSFSQLWMGPDFIRPYGGRQMFLSVDLCTALVVGSDDVAPCYSIGVLARRQVGKREGSRGARVVASC